MLTISLTPTTKVQTSPCRFSTLTNSQHYYARISHIQDSPTSDSGEEFINAPVWSMIFTASIFTKLAIVKINVHVYVCVCVYRTVPRSERKRTKYEQNFIYALRYGFQYTDFQETDTPKWWPYVPNFTIIRYVTGQLGIEIH